MERWMKQRMTVRIYEQLVDIEMEIILINKEYREESKTESDRVTLGQALMPLLKRKQQLEELVKELTKELEEETKGERK